MRCLIMIDMSLLIILLLMCKYRIFLRDVLQILLFCNIFMVYLARISSVGITMDYGLDGPGSNPGGDEILHTCPYRPWGPHSLL